MKTYLTLLLTLITIDVHSEITSYKTPGNLSSTNPANCTSLEKIKNTQSPADIFKGARKCVLLSEYDKAAILYIAAMAYSFYDKERVSDKSAHQAITVIRTHEFALQQHKLNSLQDSIDSIHKSNKRICSDLKKLGKPNYHPAYMIQHGMKAFMGKQENNGLINDFDSDATWSKSIKIAAKCKKS